MRYLNAVGDLVQDQCVVCAPSGIFGCHVLIFIFYLFCDDVRDGGEGGGILFILLLC